MLVVWNSRACFSIEISLSIAIRLPGQPEKTYLAQMFLQFGVSTLPLRHYLEGTQKMHWKFNLIPYLYLDAIMFSQNILVATFPPKNIPISSLPTNPKPEESTFYSEPSKHFIQTPLIPFQVNYRYLQTELNSSSLIFMSPLPGPEFSRF